MSGDREPVCLVSDLLYQMQCRRISRQRQCILFSMDMQRLQTRLSPGPLGNTYYTHINDLQFFQRLAGGSYLPLAPVYQQ